MATSKKNTKKKTETKKKKTTPKHSSKNVGKKTNNNTAKAKTTKKETKSTKPKSTKKDSNKKESKNIKNFGVYLKDKLPKKKPEPKTNKEKRLQKLEKLRAAKRRKKIAAIVGASLAGVYVLGCLLFSFVCFPRTIVADTDLSFQTKHVMQLSLIPNAGEYVFKADGLDFELEIDGKAMDYNFDIDQVVDRVIEKKNPLAWPYEIFMVHDFMTDSVVSFNKDVATSLAVPAIAAHNQKATPPENANLVCDPMTKDISIKDEVMGNTLDPDKTLASILGYIGSGRRHLECGEDEQVLPTLFADDDRCEDAIEQAKVLVESLLTLNMGGSIVSTLNLTTWVSWLQLKPNYVAGLNDELLNAWAVNLADQCDTLGKERHFVTPYGKSCTVKGGDNIGWQIDQEALKTLVATQAPLGKVQTLTVPCSSTLNGYGGPGQRDWGARYIDVDLSQQMARMYDDAGNMIWSSAIVSGKPGKNTPIGVYTIKAKSSPSTLIGNIDPATGKPEYETTVQYWMGFVGNSIGFHDATWQPTFGGDW